MKNVEINMSHDLHFHSPAPSSFRRLGFTGTIYIHTWDMDDCDKGTGGPKCPDGDGDGDHEEVDDTEVEDKEVDDDETTPSAVPIVACGDDADLSDTTTISVSWNFSVETNSNDTSVAAEKVCGVMSDAFIDSIDANHCAARRQLGGRRLAIKGYSAEVTCAFVGNCVPSSADSRSCGIYRADVEVVYDDEADNSSVGEVSTTVTEVAEDTLNDEGFDDNVNDALDDTDEDVTHVGYGNPNVDGNPTAGDIRETHDNDSNQGLTRVGKMAVAFTSALILLTLLLCCLCWRRNRTRDSKDATASMPDCGSIVSDGSDGDDISYRTSDFKDMGTHHGKLDVQQCTRSTCPPNKKETSGVLAPSWFIVWDLDESDEGTEGPKHPDGTEEGDKDKTTITSVPIVTCGDGFDSSVATSISPSWNFIVEANSYDSLVAAEKVCGIMSDAVIDSIDLNHCDARRQVGERHLEPKIRRFTATRELFDEKDLKIQKDLNVAKNSAANQEEVDAPRLQEHEEHDGTRDVKSEMIVENVVAS